MSFRRRNLRLTLFAGPGKCKYEENHNEYGKDLIWS